MARPIHSAFIIPALLASLLLGACGGGGGYGNSTSSTTTSPAVTTQEPNAPQLTGNTATDGFNWFNFRRQQVGVPALARNSYIDVAAQGHSNYQKLNDTITHDQIFGKPGFTGVTAKDRLNAAGYTIPSFDYAYGEVISSTSDTSGAHAAEDLITAIYHRFVIFEPAFKEVGTGAATVAGGYTYFTADFATRGLTGAGLGSGNFVVYPYASQQNVPTNFFSDNESPDPFPNPGQNEVGYPISIHADIGSTVAVSAENFTVRPRGGLLLSVKLLTSLTDPSYTQSSNAAIIPLNALASKTTYDVQFTGSVNGIAANRSWSFTTR